MRKEDVVSRNPKVMNGALVFKGTRVPVEILIQHLAAGDSLEDAVHLRLRHFHRPEAACGR